MTLKSQATGKTFALVVIQKMDTLAVALEQNTAMLEWHGLVLLFAVGSAWALLFVGLVGRALVSR